MDGGPRQASKAHRAGKSIGHNDARKVLEQLAALLVGAAVLNVVQNGVFGRERFSSRPADAARS